MQERVCVVEVDTLLSSPRHSVVASLASPALSTLQVLATECRVSSGVTASTILLLVGGVCPVLPPPVSMLMPDSGAGMGQV